MEEPKIVYYTPNQTLLNIVIEGLKQHWSIEETLQKCNEWQKERMKAEKEVFGAEITRELAADEVRRARVYILEKREKK